MKNLLLATFIALGAGLAAAQPATDRPQDRWNLAAIYPSVDAWQQDAARLESQFGDIGKCKGTLGQSAARLRECLDLQSDALKRLSRLFSYSGNLSAEDTGNAANLQLRQRASVLGARFGEAVSFVSPEILALGRERVAQFQRDEAGLKPYRQSLDNMLRVAPHTLDAAGEALISQYTLALNQSGSTYQIFANADMPWPTVTLSDGTKARLDQSGYEKHRQAKNRDDRKMVMDAFFGQWKQFERTLGTTYYGDLKEDTVLAKVRKYPDSLTRALNGNNVPRAVYDTLIASTNEHLPTLHRYFRLRARMLGLTEMRYYDIYPPLISGGREYPIDEGIALTLAAARPLGPEYVAAM